jgi:hypothetical protein
MTTARQEFGDKIPESACIIQLQLRDLGQLFNPIDPSPPREKDLDSDAERFIVTWARDFPGRATLAMRIDLALPNFSAEMSGEIRDAVHTFFHRRAQMESRDLRALLRRGRTALVIGLAFLGSCVVLGDVLSPLLHATRVKEIAIQASLSRDGWRCGVRWKSSSTHGGP